MRPALLMHDIREFAVQTRIQDGCLDEELNDESLREMNPLQSKEKFFPHGLVNYVSAVP